MVIIILSIVLFLSLAVNLFMYMLYYYSKIEFKKELRKYKEGESMRFDFKLNYELTHMLDQIIVLKNHNKNLLEIIKELKKEEN